MTDEERKRDESADALRAMAGGGEPTPADAQEAEQRAEADQLQDDADVLAAMEGKGSTPGVAGDLFVSEPSLDAVSDAGAAAAEIGVPGEAPEGGSRDDEAAAALAAADGGPVDLAAELAARAAGEPVAAAGDAAAGAAAGAAAAPEAPAPAFEGAAPALSPEQRRARAARFDRSSRRAHAYQFKKVMIPLLIVVAIILLVMGTMAVLLPSGAETSAEGAARVSSAFEGYRPWLILAAYVVGPILLLGAWLFYRDIKQSDEQALARRQRDLQRDLPADNGDNGENQGS